ncbi:polysaccharide biosynthesis protein [Deltaproteobacteria bacterium]|nr:polysaccharide biosynthesis protein [Deltaproteobacteria bacterium]
MVKSRLRFSLILLIQVLIILSALYFSYALRFDFVIGKYWSRALVLVPALLTIKLLVFWAFGLFKGWWRYVSMPDLVQILKANLVASLLFVLYSVIVYRLNQIPRSVLILDGAFCFMLMGGVRFATRAFRENYIPMLQGGGKKGQRILIVGAGDAGRMIAREIRQNQSLNFEVVGFVDDDSRKRNQSFHGFQVLGTLSKLTQICLDNGIDEVIIAIPSATGKQIKKIVDRCIDANVQFKTLPGVGELIDGRVSIQHIKDVEVEDLLGREPIRLETERIRSYIDGKRVLVSGAGGSIGSELCRQIARFKPDKLILFENAETPLFLIEQELGNLFPNIPIVPIIGDIRNRSRVNVIFDEQMPEVVFHAAAYKHVPLMECNPAEAVNNNVQGTRLLADAAHELGVQHFVMVSTDKAVKPTNVMGATKRVAELYVQSLAQKSKTHFVTTRFGNVLGSNGSVLPTFSEQIKSGGPVTVTDPEVTRYFMTISEATQLVLQAGSMGQGGEIYLFDMGKPVKIVDLAEELIRLSGLQPHEDIEIVYTGLRPGEKLYEELLLAEEGTLPTAHEKICIAASSPLATDVLTEKLDVLIADAKALELDAVLAGLRNIVQEYQPAEHKQTAKIIPHPATVIHQ